MNILKIEVAGKFPELWVYTVTVSTWFGLSSKPIECYRTIHPAYSTPEPHQVYISTKTGHPISSQAVDVYKTTLKIRSRKNAVYNAKAAAFKRAAQELLNET